MRRITISLAPADLEKAGPAYDLPIVVSILLSSQQVTADLSHSIFLGELALDGSLRHTRGILPMLALAAENGFTEAYVPSVNASEAALAEGADVFPVDSLLQLVAHLHGEVSIPRHVAEPIATMRLVAGAGPEISDVKGQEHAKRALELAAAGSHNFLRLGSPGAPRLLQPGEQGSTIRTS